MSAGRTTGVRDDTVANRFVLEDDGVEAELIYRTEPGRLILIHTEVPDALGGRGIGSQLVRASLARARAENVTVVPWCPFARRWLTGHPDEVEGVSIDWDTLPPPDLSFTRGLR
jgi:predicted GNAT family acetyltransferase